jgi:tetratricopeptide (TPR) repeat protein
MGDFAEIVAGDHYALERPLGEGGMAMVWLARDLRHDRLVALKVIRPELAGAIGVDRFLREVRLTARLRHPNIVPLLDSGVLRAPDGALLPWYAMTYLEGESLRTRLDREGQLPLEDALRITEAVAGALQAAHREKIVHRDIKPDNVLLADGHTYVVDFGIAKAVMGTGDERLTSTGVSIGTPAYMSPEQATGDQVDARSDQYSLATILYEMLAGDVPFSGSTAQAVLARRLTESARPIRPVRATVPEPVEHAVLRALQRAPADRYPDVAAFTAALRGPLTPAPRTRRRTRLAALSAALAVVAVGAVALVALPGRGGFRRGPPDAAVVALYERGMRGLAARTEEGARDALASFTAALQHDSTYGAAWAGLAQTYQQAIGRRFVFWGAAGDSVLRLAVAASDRAAALDGRNPEVLYTQALVSQLVDPTDMGPVISALRQAVAAEPRSARYQHALAANLNNAGEHDEARRVWHQAVANDPAYTEGLAFLALSFMWARQYDSAATWADSAVVVNPSYLLARHTRATNDVERGQYRRAAADFEAARRLSSGVEIPNALAGIALAEARAGRRAEAMRLMAQVESLMVAYTPGPLHNAAFNAAAYAALGNQRRALEWLEQFSPRANLHFQLHLRCDPALDPIADDPRFRALLITPRPAPSQGC